jgi:hypothetical protein
MSCSSLVCSKTSIVPPDIEIGYCKLHFQDNGLGFVQVTWGFIPREGFSDLLCDPFRRRVIAEKFLAKLGELKDFANNGFRLFHCLPASATPSSCA